MRQESPACWKRSASSRRCQGSPRSSATSSRAGGSSNRSAPGGASPDETWSGTSQSGHCATQAWNSLPQAGQVLNIGRQYAASGAARLREALAQEDLRVAARIALHAAHLAVAVASVELRRLEAVRREHQLRAAACARFALGGAEQRAAEAALALTLVHPEEADLAAAAPRVPGEAGAQAAALVVEEGGQHAAVVMSGRRVVEAVDLVFEPRELAGFRLVQETDLVRHRRSLRPARICRRSEDRGGGRYSLAPLQRLQEADRARRGVLRVQRLHLQPEAHRARVLHALLLGGAPAGRESSRGVGGRAPRARDARAGHGVGAGSRAARCAPHPGERAAEEAAGAA